MKTKLIILSLFLSLGFVSCKNKSQKEEVKEPQKEKSLTFDVTLEIVTPADVDLILYYKDGTNEWFEEEKAVWNGAKTKAEVQTVTFNMPEGVLPNDLRLDIGRNEFKGLKDVEIKRITFSYLNNKFEIQEDQIGMYFKPNQYITFDPATKLYSFKKDDKGNYDPFFETKPEVYPRIAKVATN
jgi:hypothetical protein